MLNIPERHHHLVCVCRQKVDREMTHWCRNKEGKPEHHLWEPLKRKESVSADRRLQILCLLQCVHPTTSIILRAAKET